jgi:hypothetical protein
VVTAMISASFSVAVSTCAENAVVQSSSLFHGSDGYWSASSAKLAAEATFSWDMALSIFFKR